MAAKKKPSPTAKKRERPGEYVGFRSPVWLKKQLEQAAATAGRSLSSEAQFRLEKSFEREALLFDGLDLAFGKPISGLLLLLGTALRAASLRQGVKSGIELSFSDEILHPEVRGQALLAAKLLIDELGPAAPSAPTERGTFGEMVAGELLAWLGRGAPPDGQRMEEIGSRLAPLLNVKTEPNKKGKE